MSAPNSRWKYRIYHRWMNLGGIDVENISDGSNLRLGIDWLRWMSGYRFKIAGKPATVRYTETFGTVTITAACADHAITISGRKKLIGKETYEVTNQDGPIGTVRLLKADRLLFESTTGSSEVSQIRDAAAAYWIVEAPAPLNPLLLAAIALIVRRHGVPHAGHHA